MMIHAASQGAFGNRLAPFVLFYAIALLATITVHEVGHAIAVQRVGWKVKSFAVFPLVYYPEKQNMKFWTSPSGDLGGAVTFSTLGSRTPAKLIWVAAGGPIANLVLAVLGIGLASIPLGPAFQNIVGGIAITSMFVGFGNILPWSSKGGSSDGKVLLSALKRKKQSAFHHRQ